MVSVVPRSRVLSRRAASAGLLVAGSFVILNGLSFVFSVLAARALGPAQYGVLASMMNLLLIVNVVAMGLQAVAARRIAAEPVRHQSTARGRGRGAGPPAGPVAPVGFARAGRPARTQCLRVGSARRTAGHTSGHGALARLRCHLRRFRPDAAGLRVARRRASTGPGGGLCRCHRGTRSHHGCRRAVRSAGCCGPGPPTASEWAGDQELLLAFFALSSIDVLLARAVLDEHDAGLYASGQILAKSVLFLPSFVSVVAFPRLARGGRDRLHLLGLAVVLGMGAVGVAMTALLPALALVFVGGAQYAQTSNRLWEFAALGAVLAGIQLLVTTALARRHTRAVWVLWLAVAVLTGAALLATTWDALLHIVLGVDLVVLAALVLVTRKDHITGQDLQT